MTAATIPRSPAALENKTPMLPYLQGLHQRWREEVRWMLEPARQPDAGVWMRWRAIRYLEAEFMRRFQREQQAVISLHSHLTGSQASHLWAAGELLTQLVARLESLVGLCHHAPAFASVTLNILTAHEYWCQQVEDALGGVRWGEVPADCRHLFEVISEDRAGEGC